MRTSGRSRRDCDPTPFGGRSAVSGERCRRPTPSGTKSLFSSYRKNLKNRHEEAIGEVASLRARHPMAVMGYAYLVRQNIFAEAGAYEILLDVLARLRRPGTHFDATTLVVIDWKSTGTRVAVTGPDEPAHALTSGLFFRDVVSTALDRTPIAEYVEARKRKTPTALGLLEPEDLDTEAD